MRNEVMSKMRRTQQLYDNGRLEDSWRVASDAKMFFQSYSNEVTEAMTQVQRWGVRLSGLNEVIDPMLRTQHDLDLLESYLREEIRAMQLIEEKRAR
ncbi:MAG: hypothetical protein ACXV2D_08125 [Halobacteriota archaeon]